MRSARPSDRPGGSSLSRPRTPDDTEGPFGTQEVTTRFPTAVYANEEGKKTPDLRRAAAVSGNVLRRTQLPSSQLSYVFGGHTLSPATASSDYCFHGKRGWGYWRRATRSKATGLENISPPCQNGVALLLRPESLSSPKIRFHTNQWKIKPLKKKSLSFVSNGWLYK